MKRSKLLAKTFTLSFAILCMVLSTGSSQLMASSMYSELLPGFYSGCSGGNGGECCIKFTFTATRAPETVTFDLLKESGLPAYISCFDTDCVKNQGITLNIDGDDTSFSFTADNNGSYSFYFCPEPGKGACAMLFSAFQWISVPDLGGLSEYGEGGISWNCAGGPTTCDSLCDKIKVYNNGTNIVFCVTRQQSSPMTQMEVRFSPPLQDCNIAYNPGGTGWSGPFISYPSTWWNQSSDRTEYFLFRPQGTETAIMEPCQTFCFSIPFCDGDSLDREVTIISNNDPQASADCNQEVNYTFKITTDGAYLPNGQRAPDLSATEPNYPNPLNSSNDFKTMIPFEAQTDGDAVIIVRDQAGHEVVTDWMEVTRGKHFFFFTGDNLPAGTYYYSIESPKGVLIVQRTMLIVK